MKVWLSRNAKRLAALTLVLVLVLALAACGAQTDDSAATAAPAAETSTVIHDPWALRHVLVDIGMGFENGTAGSSLKAVPFAIDLLDWGAGSTMTWSEIESAVAAWLSKMAADEQVTFIEQIKMVTGTCWALMDDDERRFLLEDTGCQASPDNWSAQALYRVKAVSAAVDTQVLTAVLADIAKNVQVGAAGSSLKAEPYAVELLNWDDVSTMTQIDIMFAVTNWLGDQDNDVQAAFSQQMDLIGTTCQRLMDSGCWSVEAPNRIEAVLEAVGLRE